MKTSEKLTRQRVSAKSARKHANLNQAQRMRSESAVYDPRKVVVDAAWPTLAETIKAAIMALVDAIR